MGGYKRPERHARDVPESHMADGYVSAGSMLGSSFDLSSGHIATYRIILRLLYLKRTGGFRVRDVVEMIERPGQYVKAFRQLAEKVCGRAVGLVSEWEKVRDDWVEVGDPGIEREELHKVAKFAVAMVDAIKPTEYDDPDFPDGWRESRDFILGKRVAVVSTPKMAATPMRNRGESTESLKARHEQYMRDHPEFAKELTR